MEKRSRRRTRDLVTQAASQGLSENEIGCARMSMMARSTNALCKGRIQMRKTNPLHLLKFGLQRTAGPYSWVISGSRAAPYPRLLFPRKRTFADKKGTSAKGRYCCKSRKSNNPKNLAKVALGASLLLHRFSTLLRRSVIDFGRNDMVPHVLSRKTHRRL
jgi:hypothetical protein